MSFRWETSRGVVKYRLFSRVIIHQEITRKRLRITQVRNHEKTNKKIEYKRKQCVINSLNSLLSKICKTACQSRRI